MAKFLSLYGGPLLLIGLLIIAACVGIAYGWAKYRDLRDQKRRDRLVEAAPYSHLSAQENIIAVNSAAVLLEALVATAEDDTLVQMQLADLIDESQRWLDKLNERLEPRAPYRPNRRTSATDEPRPRRSPG